MHILIASDPSLPADDLQLGEWMERVSRTLVAAADLPSLLSKTLPDVVVLRYPAETLPALIERVRRSLPRVVVATLGQQPPPEELLHFLRLGVADVLVENDSNSVRQFLERAEARNRAGKATDRPTAKKLAFISGKGGSGATFALSNFASALASNADGRVLLIDLSFPFGDLDLYLDTGSSGNDLLDFVEAASRIDQALLQAMVCSVDDKLDIIPGPLSPERVMRLDGESIERLIDAVQLYYEFILFDLGQAIDHIGARIVSSAERLYVVGKADLPGARRTGQLIRLLADLDLQQTGIAAVVTEWGRSGISTDEFEKAIGQPAEFRLPDAGAEANVALAKGQPLVKLAPRSAFAKAINAWVAELTGAKRKGGSLWGIFASR